MGYIDQSKLFDMAHQVQEWLRLACEYGREDRAEEVYAKVKEALLGAAAELEHMEPEASLAAKEPDDLDAIKALRPEGPRKLKLPGDAELADRMAGAVLGRFAGCLLGVPVEGYSTADLQDMAWLCGMEYPPVDYWTNVRYPERVQYGVSPRKAYTRDGMDGVAVDDDITYSILGLLILEKYGSDFTTADVGAYWKDYLQRRRARSTTPISSGSAPTSAAIPGDGPALEIRRRPPSTHGGTPIFLIAATAFTARCSLLRHRLPHSLWTARRRPSASA